MEKCLYLNHKDSSIKDELGNDIPVCLKYVNHSPDGFSWGYAGSGPSQASFAILMYVLGENKLKFVKRAYQDFKFDVMTKLNMNRDHTLTFKEIIEWCETFKTKLEDE